MNVWKTDQNAKTSDSTQYLCLTRQVGEHQKKGDSPNEKSYLAYYHQKQQSKEEIEGLNGELMLYSTIYQMSKSKKKWGRRLKFKHLKPREREGELKYD